VPENAAAVLRSTASGSGGGGDAGVGEAVIEARRALRSVQSVMQSVVQSAQVRSESDSPRHRAVGGALPRLNSSPKG